MTPVYSPIGSAPACPRSYAAEVASLETPLRVGTSCHLQLLHVLAIGVPRKRRSSSGFLKTRRTRLPRSGLVQRTKCGAPHLVRENRPLRSTWRGLETWQGRDAVTLATRKSESTGNTNFDLNRRASLRPYLREAGGEIPPAYSLRRLQRTASSPFAQFL